MFENWRSFINQYIINQLDQRLFRFYIDNKDNLVIRTGSALDRRSITYDIKDKDITSTRKLQEELERNSSGQGYLHLIFYYEDTADMSDESKVPVLIEPKEEKKKGDASIKVEGKRKGTLFKKAKVEPNNSIDTISTSTVSMYTLCSTFLTILDPESGRN